MRCDPRSSDIEDDLGNPAFASLRHGQSVASRSLDLVVEDVPRAVDRLAADRGRAGDRPARPARREIGRRADAASRSERSARSAIPPAGLRSIRPAARPARFPRRAPRRDWQRSRQRARLAAVWNRSGKSPPITRRPRSAVWSNVSKRPMNSALLEDRSVQRSRLIRRSSQRLDSTRLSGYRDGNSHSSHRSTWHHSALFQGGRPMVEVGKPAPDFSLADQHGKTVTLSKLERLARRPLFLSQGRHARLHQGSMQLSRRISRVQEKEGAIILGVSPDDTESHAKFAKKFEPPVLAARRRRQQDLRSLRCLEREKHVWQEIHGRRANDLRHRRQGDRAEGLRQGEGRRPLGRRSRGAVDGGTPHEALSTGTASMFRGAAAHRQT